MRLGALASMTVLLQKSKSAIFDGCNPLQDRDAILDKTVKNQFLQQNRGSSTMPPTASCCNGSAGVTGFSITC
jgi:hypothetical protein